MTKRNQRRMLTEVQQSAPDIRTVARHANVSIATVSRTVNGIDVVSRTTANRVWKVIESLGYSPNSQARALRVGRSRLLGLIVSEMISPFLPELIKGFERAALDHGYEVLVGSTDSDPQRVLQCVRRMLERRAEGIAMMTVGIEERLQYRSAARKLPMVFLDEGPDESGISLLKVDYGRGIRQAVQHLAVLGHRKIAFVTGPSRLGSPQSRLSAFQHSLAECGITPRADWLAQGDDSMEGGIIAAESLLGCAEQPTAVICSNEMTAIGMLQWLYRAGINVPDDLSIIGFNDSQLAQTMIPPLTTIELSSLELSRAAVTALRAHVEGKMLPERSYSIETNLVVRASTDHPRGTALPVSVQLHNSMA
jgi:LacI family transcriptional regulator